MGWWIGGKVGPIGYGKRVGGGRKRGGRKRGGKAGGVSLLTVLITALVIGGIYAYNGLFGGNDAAMPDVRCRDLQTAQDAVKVVGVEETRSQDATGAGRSQLVDSNWVVTAQTPGAGEEIGRSDVVFTVVKIGEPRSC